MKKGSRKGAFFLLLVIGGGVNGKWLMENSYWKIVPFDIAQVKNGKWLLGNGYWRFRK
jgi:hypothetical protein